jgi:hypothetical protein
LSILKKEISSLKNSIYLTTAVGIGDIEFEVKVKNPEEMYKIIDDLRTKFDDIVHFETLLIRKEHLINYLPYIEDN